MRFKVVQVMAQPGAVMPDYGHMLRQAGLDVINTARGGLVDHAALYQALASGQLAGAGLDVTDPAPIPADSPLLKLDSVIITAHSAHASIPSMTELLRRPGEEIGRVLKGEWPIGLLNPQAKEKYKQRWG